RHNSTRVSQLCQRLPYTACVDGRLLERTLARLGATSRSGRTALCDQMQALVEPWLHLRALAGLDRKSLLSLWTSCQRLDAEFLHARRAGSPTWVYAVAFLVGLGLLLGCLLVARWL